jgi:hypothetical protein
MRILFLIILSIVLVAFQQYFGIKYYAVIIPFLMGWLGSIAWDLLFFSGITFKDAEERSYHIERLNLHDKSRHAWTKHFELGEEVYYLGHDGVGGWWHGDTAVADKEMIDKKHNLHFYKKVAKIRE